MRIIHVTRQFHPAIGGLEEAVRSLARELRDRHGFDIEILTLDRVFSDPGTRLPERDEVDGLPVRRMPYVGSRRYPIALDLISAVADADLVHVHAVDFSFDMMALGSAYHRKPLVASTHGGFFHTGFARRLKKIYFRSVTAQACRMYEAIFASSENDAALFRRIAGSKVHVLENGVDTAKWSDRASAAPQRSLIYFGRLSSNKRVELWFPVLSALRRSHGDDWRMTVAGKADDVSFADLEAAARRAGVDGAVTFIPSPSSDALATAIGDASYYVSASEHEGFGISAVEAMSAGLVPVLSRIPAFERFLRDAPGISVDARQASETARAIATLHATAAANPDRRAQLLATARRYNWGTVADSVAATYRSILGERPAPGRSGGLSAQRAEELR